MKNRIHHILKFRKKWNFVEISKAMADTIRIGASKPTKFYTNKIKKRLRTSDTAHLSALDWAIQSAIDVATSLERSKIARVTDVKTSVIKNQDRSSSCINIIITRTPQFVAWSEEHPQAVEEL